MLELCYFEYIDLFVVVMFFSFYVIYIWDIFYSRYVEVYRDFGKFIRFRLDLYRVVVFIEVIIALFYI